MKSMNNNWLSVSLSPHINTEVSRDPHHQPSHHQQMQPTSPAVSSVVPTSFLLSPPHLNNPTAFYEAGGLYSQLSAMPLKSDSSLCIMEALSKPQEGGLEPTTSPKMEDSLCCGPNLGSYKGYREAVALSLDSMFYPQNPELESDRNYHSEFEQHLRKNSQVQQHHQFIQPFQEAMSSGFVGHQIYHGDDGIPSLRNYTAGNSFGEVGCGTLQPLSLSISPGDQSGCVTIPQHISPTTEFTTFDITRKRGKEGQKQSVHKKSIETFGQRTSQYRGVTRHRWTGRYEAHLWDSSCKKEGQARKGRQVYLGGYDMEEKAARAYDLAALKYWGPSTHTNFALEDYHQELEEMKNMSRQEFIAHLRRKSSGFSRGASIYRGVTRHHQHGRWQARIGRVAGNKDLYLGTFSTQEEAAEAYDIAAIKFRGANAVTNFGITRYDVERIMASINLLSAEDARRNKAIEVYNGTPSDQISSSYLDSTQENNVYQSPAVVPNLFLSSNLYGMVSAVNYVGTVHEDDDSLLMQNTHLWNTSSLVTSLSNSR